MTVTIINTGCANLSSVKFAFDRLDIPTEITDDPKRIKSAERLLLPGVGSAPYAMKNIEAKGLTELLQTVDQPILGICLGMQLLFDTLEEGGQTVKGLGLVDGHVGRLDTEDQPSPHMGWNTLIPTQNHPLLEGLDEHSYAYFVHSYAVSLSDHTVAKTHYGAAFSSVIAHKNVYGCQFHPERSSVVGAQILKNFASLNV